MKELCLILSKLSTIQLNYKFNSIDSNCNKSAALTANYLSVQLPSGATFK